MPYDTPPPPGAEAAVILPDLLEEIGGDKSLSGMFIDRRGRLAIVMGGRGLRATFGDSLDVAAVAAILLHMSQLMAVNERQAAQTAAGELDRIASRASAKGQPH
jgi:hypothetical protein